MCLILLAWRVHAHYPLVVAANRDEYHERRALPAGFWPDQGDILAGRDLDAGGSWLGITRSGRFAALTNFRDPDNRLPNPPSRGRLVADFLSGDTSPADYCQALDAIAAKYNGFNLLCADRDTLYYCSNRAVAPHALPPGVYGLSNHLLDSPWPKVVHGKTRLASALDALPDTTPLFDLLGDDRPAAEQDMPRSGLSSEWERLLSAAFIRSPGYGTRCSTVLCRGADQRVLFHERRFAPDGTSTGDSRFSLDLS